MSASINAPDEVNIPAEGRYYIDLNTVAVIDDIQGNLAKTADFMMYSGNTALDNKLPVPPDRESVTVVAELYAMGENTVTEKEISFTDGNSSETKAVDVPIIDGIDFLGNQYTVTGYNPLNEEYCTDVYVCIFEDDMCVKAYKHPVTMTAGCGEFTESFTVDTEDISSENIVVKTFVLDKSLKDIK